VLDQARSLQLVLHLERQLQLVLDLERPLQLVLDLERQLQLVLKPTSAVAYELGSLRLEPRQALPQQEELRLHQHVTLGWLA